MAELPLVLLPFFSARDLRASCLLVLYNTSGLYRCLMDKRHQPRFAAGAADTIIVSAHNHLVKEQSSSADSALWMLFSQHAAHQPRRTPQKNKVGISRPHRKYNTTSKMQGDNNKKRPSPPLALLLRINWCRLWLATGKRKRRPVQHTVAVPMHQQPGSTKRSRR
jgi:hypothetical protein